MHGFAGVIVVMNDLVLLVQEPDYFTHEALWTMPSGRIEDGETPAQAAVRELAEESGCILDAADLELIATADVDHAGATLSRSWNFTAVATDSHLEPIAPDELVSEARWFGRAEAIDLLSSSDYSPKREPAIRFLKSGDRDLRWAFELIDPTAGIPSFRWVSPK